MILFKKIRNNCVIFQERHSVTERNKGNAATHFVTGSNVTDLLPVLHVFP